MIGKVLRVKVSLDLQGQPSIGYAQVQDDTGQLGNFLLWTKEPSASEQVKLLLLSEAWAHGLKVRVETDPTGGYVNLVELLSH